MIYMNPYLKEIVQREAGFFFLFLICWQDEHQVMAEGNQPQCLACWSAQQPQTGVLASYFNPECAHGWVIHITLWVRYNNVYLFSNKGKHSQLKLILYKMEYHIAKFSIYLWRLKTTPYNQFKTQGFIVLN